MNFLEATKEINQIIRQLKMTANAINRRVYPSPRARKALEHRYREIEALELALHAIEIASSPHTIGRATGERSK